VLYISGKGVEKTLILNLKINLRRKVLLGIISLLIILLASCATSPPIRPFEEWFSVLPGDADIYFYFNNTTTGDLVLKVLREGKLLDKDTRFILSKTDKIYGAVALGEKGRERNATLYSFLTLGNYPKFFMDLNLSFNGKWKRKKASGWYWFNREKNLELAVPSEHLVAISNGEMKKLLRNLESPVNYSYPPGLKGDIRNSDILVFFPSFTENGGFEKYTKNIKIPISDVWLSLKKGGKEYSTRAVFVFGSEKHAKLFAFVFKLVLAAWLRDVKESDVGKKLSRVRVRVNDRTMLLSGLELDYSTVDRIFKGFGESLRKDSKGEK